ncbi:MAG: hypothetical protein WAK10_07810 [Methanoregula sp.]
MQDRGGGRGHPRYLIDNLLEWNYGNTVYYAAVLLLLFIAVDGLIIRGDIFRARWGFVALAIAMLPALAEYLFRIILPWPMKFLITLALILHMAGGIFEFYFTLYPVYDKIGHLVSSMAIAFLIFVAILILAGVTGKNISRPVIVISIFGIVMLFASAWEYAELYIDGMSKSTYFVTVDDSLLDTLFNLIGTSYIVLTINVYLKHEPVSNLYRRFIHWKN